MTGSYHPLPQPAGISRIPEKQKVSTSDNSFAIEQWGKPRDSNWGEERVFIGGEQGF